MLNGGTFFVFIFFAVIAYLIFLTPSHEKEPKEPQEKDEFDEHLGVPSLFIPPASSFPPVAPPVTPPATPLQPLLLSSKTMPLPSSTIVQSKKRL